MNAFLQQLINQRVNLATADEIFQQAAGINIPLSRQQAERLSAHVHGKDLDLFDPAVQSDLLQVLSSEIGREQADRLFEQFRNILEKIQ